MNNKLNLIARKWLDHQGYNGAAWSITDKQVADAIDTYYPGGSDAFYVENTK